MDSAESIPKMIENPEKAADLTSSPQLTKLEVSVMAGASFLTLLAAYRAWWSIGVVETWGFVTGGVCVWLTVKENIWNWPIGIANSAFFFVLFLRGRLFADMSLQAIYIILGFYGWINWVYGGEQRTALRILRTTATEWILLAVFLIGFTSGLRLILFSAADSAPFLDALTTTISLAAQYLLCRKRIENWWLWMAADIIYIPMYLVRHLSLTAVLYLLFLVMCIIGVREWNQHLEKPLNPS